MSFLSVIHSYWSGNTTLNNALPAATKVYTGLIPERTAFPYAVVVPVSLAPTFTTSAPYIGTFGFQISIYDSNPDNAEDLANTIAGQFDYHAISSNTISCERMNGPLFVVDPDTPQRVYHVMLEYQLLENRTQPAT